MLAIFGGQITRTSRLDRIRGRLFNCRKPSIPGVYYAEPVPVRIHSDYLRPFLLSAQIAYIGVRKSRSTEDGPSLRGYRLWCRVT